MEQGRMSVLQRNKHPTLLIQKHNKNNIFNLYCVKTLILFNTNLITKNNISYLKTILKMLQITANFVKSQYKSKKHFG